MKEKNILKQMGIGHTFMYLLIVHINETIGRSYLNSLILTSFVVIVISIYTPIHPLISLILLVFGTPTGAVMLQCKVRRFCQWGILKIEHNYNKCYALVKVEDGMNEGLQKDINAMDLINALRMFGYESVDDISTEDLRIRFCILTKKYHPDSHQNCPEGYMELIQEINYSYALLQKVIKKRLP